MYNRECTPEIITELKPNDVFVFGSNLRGSHGGGAAKMAYERFGAVWGQGVGFRGQSYAIPTMQGGVETIKPYVDDFIEFAFIHPELKFLVTRIGCGIAAFTPEEIAPLFVEAFDYDNVILPKDFVEVIAKRQKVTETVVRWNAEKDFLCAYRDLMSKVKEGDQQAYYQVKELRAKEFRNTVEIVNQGFYFSEIGTKYRFPSDKEMMSETAFYEFEIRVLNSIPASYQTTVEVLNIDCLQAAMQLQEKGYNPAVLNMASRRNPGGGVTFGAGAQEETLFRRTNLFRSLYQFAPFAQQYGITESPFQYPLERNVGGIYTPDAICFREDEQHGYALMARPATLSFITVAGMNHPDLTPDGMIADHHVGPIKNKIRTIFSLGLNHGHDSLVLGALGCGAFRNPPRHVARLFHEVMDEPEFAGKYRHIVFAILDDHNAHMSHNPEGNFKPFALEFAKPSADQMNVLSTWWEKGLEGLKKPIDRKVFNSSKMKKAATWTLETHPMKEPAIEVDLNLRLPREQMDIITYGHISESMDDHWSMYCDSSHICYYRSWTGLLVFDASYVKADDGEGYVIDKLRIHPNTGYTQLYAWQQTVLFLALLMDEFGGDSNPFWDEVFNE